MYYSFSQTLAKTRMFLFFNLWDSSRAGWGLESALNGCFQMMSILGIFGQMPWMKTTNLKLLKVCFQIQVHSIDILSQLLALMFGLFAKLKDWVWIISIIFGCLPPLFVSFSHQSGGLEILKSQIGKFYLVTFNDLGSSWQTRDERTFIESASMYCADYPYLMKNLEAELSVVLFFIKRSFVENAFQDSLQPPQNRLKHVTAKILW